MSDILVLHSVRVACQDGAIREDGSLVVREAQYVFLDKNGIVLEDDQRAVELKHGVASVTPGRLSMITAKYGPILS